jgi:hypothetical protein
MLFIVVYAFARPRSEEPESEVEAEQEVAEDPANSKLTQGKPWCIPPKS